MTTQGVNRTIEIDGLLLDPISQCVTIGYEANRIPSAQIPYDTPRASLIELDQVWGSNVYVEERSVDVYIRRLSKAMDTEHDLLIQTVRSTDFSLNE